MTSHSQEHTVPENLSMTAEERETAFNNLSAVIESADPPAWAGLPLPEKKPLMRRLWEYAVDFLS